MSTTTSMLDGGIGLIEVHGSLTGGDETEKLRRSIAGFVAQECTRLIIDLDNVTYLNSAAIGVLMSGFTSYTNRHWQLKLCGINKEINSIFVITKLTLVFDVYATRKTALGSFK